MNRINISRRTFLRLAALGGIGAGLAFYRKLTAPLHPVWYLRWKGRGLFKQVFDPASLVAVERSPSYAEVDLETIGRLWANAHMPPPDGKRILIKPNLVDSLDAAAPIATAPEAIGALVDFLMSEGAVEIKVGDGPAFRRDAFAIAQQIGLDQVLETRGVAFVDLNYDDPRPVRTRDGWFGDTANIWLPRTVVDSDLVISFAKLKTHHWAQVSLCMKNLLGILPGARYGWPKNFIHFNGIAETILGLYQVLPQVVGVVDGIVGMQGDGPLFGSPVDHGVLIAGLDPVAVDMVGKDLMGFGDWRVGYLDLAIWAGIGQANRVEIRGPALETLRRSYQKPPRIE